MEQYIARWLLNTTSLCLLLGISCLAHAATTSPAWVTSGMLNGVVPPPPCAKGNPYCAANVRSPPVVPQAKFDPNQAPCNTANEPCAQDYSSAMTQNYQQNMQNGVAPPYDPCVMSNGCADVKPWWQSSVVTPIQKKTVPYDPGARPWAQQKTCAPLFVGGVYFPNKNCP